MPKSKGSWEEDKDKFIKMQRRIEEGLGEFNVNF